MTLPNETLGEAMDRIKHDIDEIERSSKWGWVLVWSLRRKVDKIEQRITSARDDGLRRYFAS